MQPTVCAVLLTADRQEMTDRAVRSFLAQDYPAKQLLVYDTGAVRYEGPANTTVVRPLDSAQLRLSIGCLRNAANSLCSNADILIHFDSDDWSAPSRISDQVKLLVESGKQAVGYREMLFWRLVDHKFPTDRVFHGGRPGEAWLYRNTDPRYIVSTSAAYWRRVWEAKPFEDISIGEVGRWIKGLNTLGVTANGGPYSRCASDIEPRMLATIHGGNTIKQHIYPAATNPDGSPMWARVPNWDTRVREILEGA